MALMATSSSLPSLGPMPDAEHNRLMRRLEHNARAREKQGRLEGSLSVTKNIAKEQREKDRSDFIREMQRTHKDRVDRWTMKTQDSPFHANLWDEDQKIFLNNRARDKSEQLEKKRMERLQREAHQAITVRTMAEIDELEILRGEKRQLVEGEKHLKALKDVERTNARTSKVFQLRKTRELERQQAQLEKAMSVPRF